MRNTDGSLSICISHQAPQDANQLANWLPACEGDLYLCLRAYVPRTEMLDGLYLVPAVERMT
jgi:hypothetical protein